MPATADTCQTHAIMHRTHVQSARRLRTRAQTQMHTNWKAQRRSAHGCIRHHGAHGHGHSFRHGYRHPAQHGFWVVELAGGPITTVHVPHVVRAVRLTCTQATVTACRIDLTRTYLANDQQTHQVGVAGPRSCISLQGDPAGAQTCTCTMNHYSQGCARQLHSKVLLQ